MSRVSPVVGFNNNVRYKLRNFHVQTEDSGLQRPHIITHLFTDGGRIVKSQRHDYTAIVEEADVQLRVRELMQQQHAAMIDALKRGELDELVLGRPAKKPAGPISSSGPSSTATPSSVAEPLSAAAPTSSKVAPVSAAAPASVASPSSATPAVAPLSSVVPSQAPPSSAAPSGPPTVPTMLRATTTVPVPEQTTLARVSAVPVAPAARAFTPALGVPVAPVARSRRLSSRPPAPLAPRATEGNVAVDISAKKERLLTQTLDEVILQFLAEDADGL